MFIEDQDLQYHQLKMNNWKCGLAVAATATAAAFGYYWWTSRANSPNDRQPATTEDVEEQVTEDRKDKATEELPEEAAEELKEDEVNEELKEDENGCTESLLVVNREVEEIIHVQHKKPPTNETEVAIASAQDIRDVGIDEIKMRVKRESDERKKRARYQEFESSGLLNLFFLDKHTSVHHCEPTVSYQSELPNITALQQMAEARYLAKRLEKERIENDDWWSGEEDDKITTKAFPWDDSSSDEMTFPTKKRKRSPKTLKAETGTLIPISSKQQKVRPETKYFSPICDQT